MDSMLMITRRASDPKMLMMALISKNYKIGKKIIEVVGDKVGGWSEHTWSCFIARWFSFSQFHQGSM